MHKREPYSLEKSKYLLLLVDTNTSKTFFFVNFHKIQFFWFALGLKIFQTKSQFHHWRAEHCSLNLTWGGKVDKGHWETDKADCAQECVTTDNHPLQAIVQFTIPIIQNTIHLYGTNKSKYIFCLCSSLWEFVNYWIKLYCCYFGDNCARLAWFCDWFQ